MIERTRGKRELYLNRILSRIKSNGFCMMIDLVRGHVPMFTLKIQGKIE